MDDESRACPRGIGVVASLVLGLDAGTTDTAGAFVFPHPAEKPCTLRVNAGSTSTTAPIGRNAAQRNGVEIRVDTFTP
jgi:hypothetical protein